MGIAKDSLRKVGVFHFPATLLDRRGSEAHPFNFGSGLRDYTAAITTHIDGQSSLTSFDMVVRNTPQEVLGFTDIIASGIFHSPILPLMNLLEVELKERLPPSRGINPEFCTHKGLSYGEDYAPKRSNIQRMSKSNIHDPDYIVYQRREEWRLSVVIRGNELIHKSFGTGWRVCIDYRKLNEATRKDHFPLPFMDQMLERLAGNEYYCFLDGFSGYFQIPMTRDQEKTTFTCPYGTFAYRRMPFGLCNVQKQFQRMYVCIFHDMVEKIDGSLYGRLLVSLGILSKTASQV
ncbi:hypothetical protein Tco_1015113 [Tanacetum coccineum]|uniref:Reverse transcriptase domain-containing protein n=1 Tax=Tanacetum coccineum TaxID=301880 RepID=A0ABQ5FL80_9ASTR